MNPAGPLSPPPELFPPRPRWATPAPLDRGVIESLSAALRLPHALCAVLVARGHQDPDAAKRFLRPLFEHLHDPALLADGEAAADRIARAVAKGETILVHGDYDVDGVCAAALFARFLRGLGGTVVAFSPHRLRDGYDFGEAGLRMAREHGATLLVTADCGTTAVEPIALARGAGIDVVVTDHHAVGPERPATTALVNPQRPDCLYPEKGLCGTGLAFKVSELVARRMGRGLEDLHALLDLVAVATVADLVPLQGENRVLVRSGLRRLAHSRVAGLTVLLEVAGLDARSVDAGDLGFVVAPRINAAGRIGESADALALLLTDDRAEAECLARKLEEVNRERQEEDRRTLEEALGVLALEFDAERDFGVVLAREGWHPGVIGIVASRVVERIHRPTVLVALDGERGRGSARSIPGFHLYDALAACRSHMGRFGGHRQAAGMDVDRDAVAALREAFNTEARRRLRPEDLRPVLRPDAELDLADADLDLVHWLGYLEPHGMGNPRPVFLARGVFLEGPRIVGTQHLKVALRSGTARLDGIGFGLAALHPPHSLGSGPYDVLLKLEDNDWQGVRRAQARIVDLRPGTGGVG